MTEVYKSSSRKKIWDCLPKFEKLESMGQSSKIVKASCRATVQLNLDKLGLENKYI